MWRKKLLTANYFKICLPFLMIQKKMYFCPVMTSTLQTSDKYHFVIMFWAFGQRILYSKLKKALIILNHEETLNVTLKSLYVTWYYEMLS